MISAFTYYFAHSFKNQVRVRLRRLRRPKYLVSALAGFIYLYATSFRFLFGGRPRRPAGPSVADLALLPLFEIAGGVALLGLMLLPWVLPFGMRALTFKEAEVQILFPAPLTRRALINFRILKGQIGILFGVAISSFFFVRGRLVPHPAFLIGDFWIVYTFLALYNIGSSLARTSLGEHGLSGLKRQYWVLGILFAVAAGAGAWIRWFIPPQPVEISGPEELFRWIGIVAESGPAHYLLLPGRLLVRPALVADGAAFLRALVPAFAILLATYLWVIRSDASFEAAALEQSAAHARDGARGRRSARPGNGAAAGRQRRPWFRLRPAGPPFAAFLWKNLIAAGRYSPGLGLFVAAVVAVLALAPWLAGEEIGVMVRTIAGSVAAGLTGFFVVLGPVIQRDDLRADLPKINMLKSYPTAGWSIVLGEVLAPATVLAVTQWFLLAVAILFMPDFGGFQLSGQQRAALGFAAALVLPGFALLGILVQNAAALLLPGWVHLGKERKHGVEAMGQRLIMMAATFVVLVVAVIPAGAAFAACYLLGHRLIGLGVVPVAAMIATLGLLAEAALAVVWLGRVFDRFDPSTEQEVLGDEA